MPDATNIDKKVEEIGKSVTTGALITRSMYEWRKILAQEVQVYTCGATYFGKRFNEINYNFYDKEGAKEVVIDNLYALLRYKYFPSLTDEVDKRISEIVNSFVQNLKTTLIKVSFDKFDNDAKIVKYIPNTCVAFRNGVFDFWKNDWLFKYDTINVPTINNTIYMYDPQFVIMWYFNFDFEPLPGISIQDMELRDFIEFMKEYNKEERNYCFELMYNMCHDYDYTFSYKRFNHLCEILGYTILQSFTENFVMFIGSGQNGKNSLFDGCFINRLVPKPSSIDLQTIEDDKFVTGSLVHSSHNIFLETEAETHTKSKMLKQLTGSPNQSIQPKGIQAFPGIINCKYVFAGNDQDKIKFSDNTHGFRRRINIFEIYYQWDAKGNYLNKGDYYETSFSDDLHELTEDLMNTIIYVYLGMYGLMSATKYFEKNFKFSSNDWKLSYSDIDFDLKEKIENITIEQLARHLAYSRGDDIKGVLKDTTSSRTDLYNSDTMKEYGVHTLDDMINLFKNDELSTTYFAENDIFMNIKTLQKLILDNSQPNVFQGNLKKMFSGCQIAKMSATKIYLMVGFTNGKLKVRN